MRRRRISAARRSLCSRCRALVYCAALLFMVGAGGTLRAQEGESDGPARTTRSAFIRSGPVFTAPYAGKYEARIGGSRESENGKLRLDIGYAAELYRIERWTEPTGDDAHDPLVPWAPPDLSLAFGADFFTWTRLRSTASFKFPVEAVDYYFGLSGAMQRPLNNHTLLQARLRLAHISAHLVDGDPSFTDPAQRYMTYSREFADVTVGLTNDLGRGRGGSRAYAGALAMFHSIPDTLGAVTPYVGVEINERLIRSVPLTLRAGYELRLNTELADVAEHSARLGLKLGEPGSRGVTVEGSFFHGRSHYGQHFNVVEEYFALGFAVDF